MWVLLVNPMKPSQGSILFREVGRAFGYLLAYGIDNKLHYSIFFNLSTVSFFVDEPNRWDGKEGGRGACEDTAIAWLVDCHDTGLDL